MGGVTRPDEKMDREAPPSPTRPPVTLFYAPDEICPRKLTSHAVFWIHERLRWSVFLTAWRLPSPPLTALLSPFVETRFYICLILKLSAVLKSSITHQLQVSPHRCRRIAHVLWEPDPLIEVSCLCAFVLRCTWVLLLGFIMYVSRDSVLPCGS